MTLTDFYTLPASLIAALLLMLLLIDKGGSDAYAHRISR